MEQDEVIVTVMQKHYIKENTLIYSMVDSKIGTIDEKTKIFKDKVGNEYCSIEDMDLLFSEIPFAYANVARLQEIKGEHFNQEEAIIYYEEQCKNFFFYVSLNNNKPFYLAFNTNQLKQSVQEIDETEVLEIEDVDEYDALIDKIENLITGVENDEYTLEELEDIHDSLLDSRDVLDVATETIENKMELLEEQQEEPSSVKKEKTSEKDQFDFSFDINEVYHKVLETLIAQDEAVRRMLVEFSRMDNSDYQKKGILLTGSTGVGKTKMMQLLAKYLNRPMLIIDSTQLTSPGYTGKDIEEYLWDLYVACEKDVKKAERAIIYFDEIDKKGSNGKGDVAGQAVLNVLLKFLDGTTYSACQSVQLNVRSVNINTANMLIVAGGAFEDVYHNMYDKQPIGIFAKEQKVQQKRMEPQADDFVEKALMTKEFMGRFPIVIHLNDLNEAIFRRILLESNESPLKQEQSTFEKLGTKLTVLDSYLAKVIEKAQQKKTGARGLAGIVANSTWKAYDDVLSNKDHYEEVILSADTVENNENYQLIKKKA